jgi:uncharacterized damage-inducible protein DinB
MHPLEGLAGLGRFATANTVHNLKFIPEDKLDWKPAPSAKSAYEIIGHLVAVLTCMKPVMEGHEWAPPQETVPTSLEQAQQVLSEAGEAYLAAITRIPPETLGNNVTIWGGYTVPLARAASMPVVDLIHHHGQIAYIQTLLGDEAMHFFEAGT